MKDIAIPFHLAAPVILCLVGLSMIVFYYKILKKNRLFWNSLILFLGLYLLIVGKATYDTIYYQWDLNRYDLNKDGFFNGTEITNSQKEAMKVQTNDTGRNFLFILGFIFAFFSTTIFYVLGLITSKVIRSKK
jgi:hypothetical protein